MKIAIWAENTTQAGGRAWLYEGRDQWESDDIVVYEGTGQEIRDCVDGPEQASKSAGASRAWYMRRTAQALREVLREEG